MNINPLYFVAERAVYYVENKWHILTFFQQVKARMNLLWYVWVHKSKTTQ